MSNHLTTIPLQSYLYMYASKQPNFRKLDGVLVIPHTLILHNYKNMDSWARYFSRHKKSRKIQVQIDQPTSERKYALIQMLSHKFREDLGAYTIRHLRLGLNAVQSIEAFLDLYGIGEDEFKFEAAYKIWQRSRHYRIWQEEAAQRYHPNTMKA